ncbi:Tetratricopeptide repeat protein [Pirellulimonas nuda]|uniref:Tetratricopeptide repeat protein n=1 Tax=Pirellulimonas nuda TaxID=2528009 RepID=A0A518DIE1_9BACT|nr:hypothetical protein [Pirellulimonas nuda]QDU91245.1 Tetratricopeptide repeat protein [Pirellulimonas nuda]
MFGAKSELFWNLTLCGCITLAAPMGSFAEDSVLVATRKALSEVAEGENAAPVSGDSALSPIPQLSEQSPEPAEQPAEEPIGQQSTAKQAAPKKAGTPPASTKAAAAKKPSEPAGDAQRVSDGSPAKPAAAEPSEPVGPAVRVASAEGAAPGDLAGAYRAAAAATETATFQGVTPGKTTAEQLASQWGDAERVSAIAGGEVRHYSLPPFAGVDVLLHNGVVKLVKVELAKQENPDRLAQRIRVDHIEPVSVEDETTGEALGVAYPEKGLLLLLAPAGADGAPQFVTHLAIQPEDAEAFALRAEKRPAGEYQKRLADLERAVSIDKNNSYAWWMLAQQRIEVGQLVEAEEAALKAMALKPDSDAFRLRWCECLAQLGRYDQAVLESRKVLDSQQAPRIVRAQSLELMGRLAALGEAPIAEKAIGFHDQAIKIADELIGSDDRRERLAAQQLLLEAHLATAEEIARRKYNDKEEVVGQWIGRASGLAEKMIEDGEAGLEVRLRVASSALSALTYLRPAKDPSPWIKEAEETATLMLADSQDALLRASIEWQLGEVYFRALQIEHTRREPKNALRYGELALEKLGSGGEVRANSPAAGLLVGELYFHLGALQAVHLQNHEEAVGWYDRAQPLLEELQPESELFVPRRYGESLVSMAVSYWEQDQKDEALRLTERGAELMNESVGAGVLDAAALAVPYGNLATMHKKLGETDEAAKYNELLKGIKSQSNAAAAKNAAVPLAKAPR